MSGENNIEFPLARGGPELDRRNFNRNRRHFTDFRFPLFLFNLALLLFGLLSVFHGLSLSGKNHEINQKHRSQKNAHRQQILHRDKRRNEKILCAIYAIPPRLNKSPTQKSSR